MNVLLQLLEPIAPRVDELVIIQVFVDDDIQERQTESRIGARTNLQMIFRMGTEPRKTRVDGNHLRTTLHHVDKSMTKKTVAVSIERVFSPQTTATSGSV